MNCCAELTSGQTAHAFPHTVQSKVNENTSPLIAAGLSSTLLISILAQHLNQPPKTNSLIELGMSSIILRCESLLCVCVCLCTRLATLFRTFSGKFTNI